MIPPNSPVNPNRRSRIRGLIVCLALGCCAFAKAQVFDATNLREPTELAAGWLVHAGDDPAYARPDFGDSQWTAFNAKSDDLHNLFPRRPAIVWYRLHVKVAPDETALALLETSVERAFEIYSNGVRLLKVGQVAPFVPYNASAYILLPIPKDQIASQSIVIALRVRTSSRLIGSPGFHSTSLTIGQEGALRDRMWLTVIGRNALLWLAYLINLAICIGALLLFLTQRGRTEYLWLFLETLCLIPGTILSVFSSMHTYPVIWDILGDLPGLVWPYFVMRMYCAFVGHQVGWKLNVFAALTSIAGAYKILLRLGVANELAVLVTYTPWVVLLAVILPAIMIKQTLRGKYLEGILLIPLLLQDFGYVSAWVFLAASQIPKLRNEAFHLFNVVTFIQAGPFTLDVVWLSGTLANFLFALIVLIRSNRMSRQQEIGESA